MTHLHRGRAPEQRQDEGRAPGQRGETQAPQVPALTADIGPVLERSNLWTQQFNLNPEKSFQWQRKIFK